VRHHGSVARIEVAAADIRRLLKPVVRRSITKLAKRQGFLYIAVDLEGYRTGSMNEGRRKQTSNIQHRTSNVGMKNKTTENEESVS